MSLASAERFVSRLETEIEVGLARIDAAEKRGQMSVDDMKFLDDIEWSKIPILAKSFEIAMRQISKPVRNRDHLVPNVLERKGLHVSNDGTRPEIYIYGPIGESHGGVSADEFRSQLERFPSGHSINLHVHSPGGSFSEAVAIHSLVSNRRGDVYGYVDGLAASAGSLILMACTSITMASASRQMIHYASLEPRGSYTEEDLATALKLVQDTNRQLLQMYSARWKRAKKELDAALTAETYYTAAECVEHGLADYISSAAKVAAYKVVTGTCKTPGFSIAASEGPQKKFWHRRAALKLWWIESVIMRGEIAA